MYLIESIVYVDSLVWTIKYTYMLYINQTYCCCSTIKRSINIPVKMRIQISMMMTNRKAVVIQWKAKWEQKLIWWHSNVKKLKHENAFKKTWYRIILFWTFNKLVSLLESQVTGNYSNCDSAEAIYLEILVLTISIHWLVGCSYINIWNAYYDCSIASIHRFWDLFLETSCSSLQRS